MDLNRIKYFITLAEQLHFGRAADLLYISQSSLSYHISELERELGVRLFVRSKRRVTLTSAGIAALPLAKELQDDAERFCSIAQSGLKDPTPETLRICFDSSFERFDLLGIAKAITSLHATYPHLKISFGLKELPDLMAATESMDFDIGFGILRNDERAKELLNTLPLYEDSLSLVYNAEMVSGAEIRDLLQSQPLYLTQNDIRWTDYILNILGDYGTVPTPTLMNNFSDILTHVYLGEGITILPYTQYRAEAVTRPGLQSIPMKNDSCLLRTCAFWAKGNYNYAITMLLSSIQISPEVSSLFG